MWRGKQYFPSFSGSGLDSLVGIGGGYTMTVEQVDLPAGEWRAEELYIGKTQVYQSPWDDRKELL